MTDAELRLMHVLWRLRRATVAAVVTALRGHPRLAYNTVLTTLRILEQKKYVTHGHAGRAFVYRVRVTEEQAQQRAVRHLLLRLFNDSPSQLFASLLGDAAMGPGEFVRIRTLITDPGAAA